MAFIQCNCAAPAKHNGHCWFCNTPIIYAESERVYITDDGHIANYCRRKECAKIADHWHKQRGFPPPREEVKTTIDSSHPQFENFIRAFWRRIEPYKNDFDKELPEKLPIQFRASMETALLQLYRTNSGGLSEESHDCKRNEGDSRQDRRKISYTNIS